MESRLWDSYDFSILSSSFKKLKVHILAKMKPEDLATKLQRTEEIKMKPNTTHSVIILKS